jgi:hypothetical protein
MISAQGSGDRVGIPNQRHMAKRRVGVRHAILAESQPALKVSFNRPRPSLSRPAGPGDGGCKNLFF